MANFVVKILTGDRTVYSGVADYIQLPSWDGDVGLFPGHVPLVAMLRPGVCILKNGNEEFSWIFSEGFLSVEKDSVDIALSSAYKREDIDFDIVSAELRSAESDFAKRNTFEDTDPDYLNILRLKSMLEFVKAEN